MNFRKMLEAFGDSESNITSLELRTSLESPSVPLSSAAAFNFVFSGDPTEAGEFIGESNALQIPTVYACVRLIAENIATFPVKVYSNAGIGKKEALDHSLSYLLSYAPNHEMTSSTFFEALAGSLALTGNCYAEIERDKKGNAIALWPLHPLKTAPQRDEKGVLSYKTTDGTERVITAKDMIHVPLVSFDGLRGLSPVGQARQALGLAMATIKSGARFFGNGSRPGGILTPKTASNVSPEQGQQMKAAFEGMTAGLNAGRIAVIPSDWSYTQIGLSLEDSQYLESRAFSRNEIAGLFRIDPHYLGDTTRQSNANSEHSALSLVQDTLQPYITKIQQELNRKLLPPTGRVRSTFHIAFDYSERLKTDFKSTLEAIAVARQWGIFTANEGREKLGLDPVGDEGNILMNPTNMMNSALFPDWYPNKAQETKSTRTRKKKNEPEL
ncbi:phage portal protein [Terriglobus roseus]|uniref:Phage portal protein, HK97 family n=1 Tax=Terriglobus roseus TaxID=392734 RepID=A0A1G7G5Q1_9BACT|nr:phage portal protein [Terriglobus roseus]SDE83441.1 phage portal protein, HK97 family [Terriglobus roseus]